MNKIHTEILEGRGLTENEYRFIELMKEYKI